MNPAARILLLIGALVLLVFGIVCLKQRLVPEPLPPAFVPADPGATERTSVDRRPAAPTILSAEPSHFPDLSTSPPFREVEPLPLDDATGSIDYPINTEALPVPSEKAPGPGAGRFPAIDQSDLSLSVQAGSDEEAAIRRLPTPSRAAVGRSIENAASSEPADIPPANSLRAGDRPTTILTRPADSLWTISQQVYGRGDYYKALFVLNRARLPHPDRIAPGVLLAAPPLAELRRLCPAACPRVDPLDPAETR